MSEWEFGRPGRAWSAQTRPLWPTELYLTKQCENKKKKKTNCFKSINENVRGQTNALRKVYIYIYNKKKVINKTFNWFGRRRRDRGRQWSLQSRYARVVIRTHTDNAKGHDGTFHVHAFNVPSLPPQRSRAAQRNNYCIIHFRFYTTQRHNTISYTTRRRRRRRAPRIKTHART